jgi:energy-coupling factor transporter ATP-binding protein EcfA2
MRDSINYPLSAYMTTKLHYMRHGILPFVGRTSESERLLAFCRETPSSSGIRCLLLTGETGSGKSRLIQEVLPALYDEHAVILRLKVNPENCHDMVGPLSHALMNNSEVCDLLKTEIDGSMNSVMGTLRRVIRLRVTILIIEDFHLIDGECLSIFSGFLESFSDEPLSVILAARPLDRQIKQLFQSHIVDEIVLGNLTPQDLRSVWKDMFDAQPGDALIPFLQELSNGNPKNLRAVVSEVLTNDLILQSTGIVSADVADASEQPATLRLKAFGGFKFEAKNGEFKPLGQRLTKVLALLAAQEMMRKPLEFCEFCKIAADGEPELDRARNIVYIALHRLKKDFGENILDTTGQTPRLNHKAVWVDAVEVNDQLDEVFTALKYGMLIRAVYSIKAAMTLWDGATLFSGLYDTFFESAREEFEFKLSSAIIKVAQALLREEDVAQAKSILEQAHGLLKEDEAITNLYRKALTRSGRFMELHSVASN